MDNRIPEYMKIVTPPVQPESAQVSCAGEIGAQEDNFFVENSSCVQQGEEVSIYEVEDAISLAELEYEQEQYGAEIDMFSYTTQDALTIEDYSPEQIIETTQALEMYEAHVDSVLEKYFPNKSPEEITDEDIERALMMDTLQRNNDAMVSVIEKYFATEGCVDDGYNWLKELVSLGISHDDMVGYIEAEKFKNSLLQTALTNGKVRVVENTENLSDEELLAQGLISREKLAHYNPDVELGEYNFDDMYKILTGVEYDSEKIAQLGQLTPVYNQIATNYAAAEGFEAAFENFSSPTQVVNYYQQMLGCTKEEAIACFNDYYATSLSKLDNGNGFNTLYGECLSFRMSDDGTTLTEEYKMTPEQYYNLASSLMLPGKYDAETGIYTINTYMQVLDASLEQGFVYTEFSGFRTLNSQINAQNLISSQVINEYNQSELASEFGTFDEVIEKFETLTQEAYGKNELSEKFAAYQKDMDSYAGYVGSGIAAIGLILSCATGVGAFGAVALFGGFADNTIDLFNLASNEVDDEFGQWSSQFAKEAVAVAIGFGLGGVAGKFGNSVCANLIRKRGMSIGVAKTLGTTAEAVTDFVLSYPADVLYEAMLTGKFNWEGNLLANIFGSAMDIKGGIGAYRALKAGKANFEYRFADGAMLQVDKQGVARFMLDDGLMLEMSGKNKNMIYTRNGEYEISGNSSAKRMTLLNASDSLRNTLLYNKSLSKKIFALDEAEFNKFLSLSQEGFEPLHAFQISRLPENQTKMALDLIGRGIPNSRAADAAVLCETPQGKAKIEALMANPDINKYYVADIALLSDAEYSKALEAITQHGITAPSAIANAKDLVNGKTTFEAIKAGKMKQEVTPEVEAALLSCAKTLSSEYANNVSQAQDFIQELITGNKNIKISEDDPRYEKPTSRSKSDSSVMAKLIAKYEKGDLKLTDDPLTNVNAARSVVSDAYGVRLQLKNLTQDDVLEALAQNGLNHEGAMQDFKDILANMMNGQECKDIDKRYLEALDILKAKQTQPIYLALKAKIENGEIQLSELNNYGGAISSYFTKAQLAELVDTYRIKNGQKILYTVTQNANVVATEVKNKKIDPVDMMGDPENFVPEYISTTGKTGKNIDEFILSKGAVKNSGYATTQMTFVKQMGDLLGLGEFQIRGVEVNKFGDIEHIPYDIRQGKITGKDIEYKEAYDIISNMSDSSYEYYNTYLTNVYDYLRLKELGIDMGEMPKLDSSLIVDKNNLPFDIDPAEVISYDGLLKYAH